MEDLQREQEAKCAHGEETVQEFWCWGYRKRVMKVGVPVSECLIGEERGFSKGKIEDERPQGQTCAHF